MKMCRLFITIAMTLLAMALIGCSSDNTVAPADANGGLTGSPDKAGGTQVNVHGIVYWEGGMTPADSVWVSVDLGYPNGYWSTPTYCFTNAQGGFSTTMTLYNGYLVRCASLGDIEVRDWYGESQMTFYLVQQPGFRGDYWPMVQ